uniref:Secreted protein n=1 Tax=Parascaris univalens TaxID=6257 RepID=A0A915BDN9_PARUN
MLFENLSREAVTSRTVRTIHADAYMCVCVRLCACLCVRTYPCVCMHICAAMFVYDAPLCICKRILCMLVCVSRPHVSVSVCACLWVPAQVTACKRCDSVRDFLVSGTSTDEGCVAAAARYFARLAHECAACVLSIRTRLSVDHAQ